jgi:hypothetical protein
VANLGRTGNAIYLYSRRLHTVLTLQLHSSSGFLILPTDYSANAEDRLAQKVSTQDILGRFHMALRSPSSANDQRSDPVSLAIVSSQHHYTRTVREALNKSSYLAFTRCVVWLVLESLVACSLARFIPKILSYTSLN